MLINPENRYESANFFFFFLYRDKKLKKGET